MAEIKYSPSAVDPVPASQEDTRFMSSPPRAAQAIVDAGGKERRQPSITPRKFRRFFTPRSRVSAYPSAARRALRDLTARALNRSQAPADSPLQFSFSPLANHDKSDVCFDVLPSPRSVKRRKTGHHTPETSPLRPSSVFLDAVTPEPISKMAVASTLLSPLASSPLPAIVDEAASDCDSYNVSDESESELPYPGPPYKRTIPLAERGFAGQLLQRQFGAVSGAGHLRLPRPVAGKCPAN